MLVGGYFSEAQVEAHMEAENKSTLCQFVEGLKVVWSFTVCTDEGSLGPDRYKLRLLIILLSRLKNNTNG